jgi:hypothetical protein
MAEVRLALVTTTPAAGTPAPDGMHQEKETEPWAINIPDHPDRSDSPAFVASKNLADKIAGQSGGVDFWGTDAIQMHHGGSLYLLDDNGWFIVKNIAGIEWSAQFCADPAKVEQLRQNAVRLYAAFPKSIPGMVALGYKQAESILTTPITDAAGIAQWVDSIFNSCVPVPATRHTGTLPSGGGVHHYPTPITDIDLVKHADFVLWVTDPQSGQPAAVVPTAPRGQGVASVQVVYATPGTALHDQLSAAHAKGQTLQLPGDHPLARAAFVHQQPTAAASAT